MAGENVSASLPSRMDMINSLFVRGEELMAKLGCQVFILVSEDGIKSNYAGSEVFLRQFHTCGLKINPGDTERTQEKIHTHMLSEKSVYNRDITYRYGNSQRVLDSIVQNNQSLNFLVIKEEEPPYSGCAVSVVTTETPRTDSYLATDVVSNVAATEQKDDNIDADNKRQISVKEYFSANKSVQGSNVDEEEMATSVTMETDANMKTSTPESSSFTEEESKYAEKDEKDDAVLLPGNQSCCEEDSEGSDTSDGKKVLGDDEEEIKEKDESDDTMLLPGNQSCGEEDLGGRDTSDGRKVLEDDEEEIKEKDERDDAVLLPDDQNCGEEDPDGHDTSDERKVFDDDQEETKDEIQDMQEIPSEKLYVPLESGIKFPLNKRKSKEGSFTEMNLRERRPGKREKEKFKATEGNSPKRKPKNQKKGDVNKMREEQSGSVSMERECLKRLKCDEADDPEKFRDLVKKIFTESNESKTNLCEKCGISFKSPGGLECHKKIVDCAERKCQYCGLTFWFRPWQQHVINDHLRRIVIYECNTCGKQYLKRLDFNIHYETHEPDETPCVCTICGLELQNVRSLKSHERFMHHVTEMKCDFCDYKTVRKHQLVKHMQRHTNGDKFKCKDCGKQLISGNSLRRHMERFHLKLNYHCSDCGKAFALRHALNLHVARHHQENPTLFICEKCGKGYHTRTLLTSHLRVTHSEETVQCEICGKAFTHVAKLRQHLVIHDKAKFLTIPCERCPKKFRHKSRLKRHMVAVHSDIKYHCEFCEYWSKVKGNVKKHMKVHKR
ncbi:zinc finger protein 37-like [Ptychodera flava]|uniref:zinc finger protein 37-like n=1 Tax=Ptychodera flava TaxID=63121 RepID=UPI003969CFD3